MKHSNSQESKCRKERLEELYLQTKVLYKHQYLASGLFPVYFNDDTSPTTNLIDNVFTCVGLWSLALAYRKIDDDMGRQYLLEQVVVKCMRGIQFSLMQQISAINKFKKTQDFSDSPILDFDLVTGAAASTKPKLSIFSISLWLLYLAEFTSSGLEIIFTEDEVNFVQNMVYCIERAYRTPDFSVWDKGEKSGAELSASSIGMAIAALEAIDGLDLFFGSKLHLQAGIIHVDPDPLYRCRAIFSSILPQESTSKASDALLKVAFGFPGFATRKYSVFEKTNTNTDKLLRGSYGYVRFPADVYENKDEQQFPLFFTLDAITQFCYGNYDAAKASLEELKPLIVYKDGCPLIPECYFPDHLACPCKSAIPESVVVPKDLIRRFEKARASPKKRCEKCIWKHNNRFSTLSQALYTTVRLLNEGFISVRDIDPINRSVRRVSKFPLNGMSGEHHMLNKTDIVVPVCLIAEHEHLQSILSAYGIETQTVKQIEPINILPPSILVEFYTLLGQNKKLNISGRPPRPMGSLATSKVYQIQAKTFVFNSIVIETTDFYLSLDLLSLIDKIKDELRFLRENWTYSQRPLFSLLLVEAMFQGDTFADMIDLMASMKQGNCGGVKVKLGRLQQFISTSYMEPLKFLSVGKGGELIRRCVGEKFNNLHHGLMPTTIRANSMKYNSSCGNLKGSNSHEEVNTYLEVDNAVLEEEISKNIELESRNWSASTVPDLIDELRSTSDLVTQAHILSQLSKRVGLEFNTEISEDATIYNLLDEVYRTAGIMKKWSVIRLVSGIKRKIALSLAPSVTEILVHGLEIEVGVNGKAGYIISEPIAPGELSKKLFEHIPDVSEAVLQQEILLCLSRVIKQQYAVFEGISCLRLGYTVEALKSELAIKYKETSKQRTTLRLLALSPFEVKKLFNQVISSVDTCRLCETTGAQWSLFSNRGRKSESEIELENKISHGTHSKNCTTKSGNWIRRRFIDGLLMRVNNKIYEKVWDLLHRIPALVQKNHELRLCDLGTDSFEKRKYRINIEKWLVLSEHPEERIIYVELLFCLWVLLAERLPEIIVITPINLDDLVNIAITLYTKDMSPFEIKKKTTMIRTNRTAKRQLSQSNTEVNLTLSTDDEFEGVMMNKIQKTDSDEYIDHEEGEVVTSEDDELMIIREKNLERYVFENNQEMENRLRFYSAPRGTINGTVCYLAKAVVKLLQSVLETEVNDCNIS